MRSRIAMQRNATTPAQKPASVPHLTAPAIRSVIRTPRPQAKLSVSTPGDASEREADHVAGEVMRMSDGPLVQRTCTNCEEEQKVHRTVATHDADGSLGDAATHAVSSSGSGRPLSGASRQFFEPRFNVDFSGVRIHDGAPAERSAHSINARAFTYGSDIWLGSGERESNRSLLAHELVHVTQQRQAPGLLTVRRYVRTNTARLRDIYLAAGQAASDVTDAQLRTTIEYEDYTRADLMWRFSDIVAIAALRRSMDLFGSGVRGRGPNFIRSGREASIVAHGIASFFAMDLDVPAKTVASPSCTKPPDPAVTPEDFIFLVQCAEAATNYSPRKMLSLLRQLYYGNESWSLHHDSHWSEVIPCGLVLPDPQPLLGDALYKALRESQDVGNPALGPVVGMGHFFTGLEAMVCPTASVELKAPWYYPNPVVDMPNEEFATWGGDIGSAAAQKTHDEVDLGRHKPWIDYFGTGRASEEDLRGDIDAHVVRQSISGFSCASSAHKALPALTSPISEILSHYYSGPASPGATTQADRFRCFIRSIGGTISGASITNKAALVAPLRDRVLSFAETYYLGKFSLDSVTSMLTGGALTAVRISQYSKEVTVLFLDWLEQRL